MRWLLTSWGSHGDLHPFLALGRGLISRGHEVSLVGHADWRMETEAAGLRFLDSGEPSRDRFIERHPEVLSSKWNGLVSIHTLVHKLIAGSIGPMCEALLAAAPAHDVIVAHHFVLGAPIVAERTGTPWATVSLAPGVVPSAYSAPGGDFSPVHEGPWPRLRNRVVWNVGRPVMRRMVDPMVNRLRQQHGLHPVRDVLFGHHSPQLNLQLYSRHFAPPAPDWSEEKQQAGFCFYDPPGADRLPPEMEEFLQAGPPPILFTLGSVAVERPGDFYRVAVEALQKLALRGVLLVGREENRPTSLPETVKALPYAPFGLLMPRVRAVVHQCGIGTLSHALRSGIPSIGCPFAFDQPNNSRRLDALGVGETLLPQKRDVLHLVKALERLLAGDAPLKAARLGEAIRAEDGVALACRLLEEKFATKEKGSR